jgi:hypothetical protein
MLPARGSRCRIFREFAGGFGPDAFAAALPFAAFAAELQQNAHAAIPLSAGETNYHDADRSK